LVASLVALDSLSIVILSGAKDLGGGSSKSNDLLTFTQPCPQILRSAQDDMAQGLSRQEQVVRSRVDLEKS
jgi:hypothetical protein